MKLSQLAFLGATVPLVVLATACSDGKDGNFGESESAGSANGGAGVGGHSSGTDSGVGGFNLTGGSGTNSGGAQNCGSILQATVRDFHAAHPDFEAFDGDDTGIVEEDLGNDKKPVYAGNPTTSTTSGKANFDQWYRDVEDVNEAFKVPLQLEDAGGGLSTYNNSAYFPLDDKGFENEGNNHNFHFTTEIHTVFTYKGGEVFTFTGDDDLFAYINKKLVINLGGVHGAETTSVDLDAVANDIGIEIGETYPLDLFGAERHTTESNFRIDTTITCFEDPPPS